MNSIERFWSKVNKATDTGCWEWTASLNVHGYGQFSHNGVTVRAHRHALDLSGIDLTGKLVCHHCDNPRCVNPAHLFLGTHKDNTQDMINKNRRTACSSQPMLRKLTDDQVKDIRSSQLSQSQINAQYGISRTALQSIIYNKTYKDII